MLMLGCERLIQYTFFVARDDKGFYHWPVLVIAAVRIKIVLLNPLTLGVDLHVTSPYNTHTLSSKKVMRILKLIR